MRVIAACLAIAGSFITTSALAPPPAGQERQMGGVGLTVFEHIDFGGRSATFRQDMPNLRSTGLDNRVSSLRVAAREQWEVCDLADYRGRCVVVSGEESDLRRNAWNDIISSARRVRGTTGRGRPPQQNAYIVLFEQPNYRGNPTNFDRAVPRISRRVRSVTIGSGVWEVCEGQNFTGRCVTLDRNVPNLAAQGMRDIGSVRPVQRRPR